jgi:GxxExxY protein
MERFYRYQLQGFAGWKSGWENKLQNPINKKQRRVGQRNDLEERTFMTENEISEKIIGCAIEVHKLLGPGLLESAYLECLFYELQRAGLFVEKQKSLPLIYKDIKLEAGYRLDLLVENKVVIELKSVDSLNEIHIAQVLTYLKLSGCKLGLLMNFNVLRVVDGIKRLVNKL